MHHSGSRPATLVTDSTTLTYKLALSSNEPSYLCSLLITHQPARNLQSSTLNLLTVTATAIWNNLPADIRGTNSLHFYHTEAADCQGSACCRRQHFLDWCGKRDCNKQYDVAILNIFPLVVY